MVMSRRPALLFGGLKRRPCAFVFWPAAFLVGGDGQVAAQLSQLKGQLNAVEQASIQKKCGIQFRQAPPAS
jgi:hypothetical protein